MVSRDQDNRAAAVPAIEPENDEQRAWYACMHVCVCGGLTCAHLAVDGLMCASVLCNDTREAAGEKRQAMAKQARRTSLDVTPPTADELSLVHQLFMSGAQAANRASVHAPATLKMTSDTEVVSTIICHPQVQ